MLKAIKTIKNLIIIALNIIGEIEGLPENHSNIGNVFLVNSDNDTIQLSLTCRCTLFQPLWQVYEVESELSDPFTGDLRCTNTTNANQACNTETSHLAQETPNVSVLNSYDFIITETTAIMCFSDEIRQIVIVTVQGIYIIILVVNQVLYNF